MHGVGGDVALAALSAGRLPGARGGGRPGRPRPRLPDGGLPQPGGARRHGPAAGRGPAGPVPTWPSPTTPTPTAWRWPCPIRRPGAGGWRVLTGDELGWLLADHVLRHTDGGTTGSWPARWFVVAAGQMAAEPRACASSRPSPGFKWIARAADDVPAGRFVFGYEEALGYAVHDLVRDKDGISAALAIAEVAALAAGRRDARGRSAGRARGPLRGGAARPALAPLRRARRRGARWPGSWPVRAAGRRVSWPGCR